MSVGIPRRSRVITSPASSRVIDETSLHGIYGFELKDAYRMLYQRVPLKDAIARMQKGSSAAVKELAAFLESGKRGFAHPQE